MIRIICIGKLKETYLKEACKEYEKRLSKYTKLEIIEIEDSKIDSTVSLKKEAEVVLKYIKDHDFVITLEIDGQEYTSVELAKTFDRLLITNSNLTFVIGSSHGLHETVCKRSNMALSFSKLTFPHQLFRVMLLEQLYRIYKINYHESYHK